MVSYEPFAPRGVLPFPSYELGHASAEWWVHLSVSRRERLPSWDDLLEARDVLLGDVECYQVLPTAAGHVDIHKYCLHLWHCPSGPSLPDFTRGSNQI